MLNVQVCHRCCGECKPFVLFIVEIIKSWFFADKIVLSPRLLTANSSYGSHFNTADSQQHSAIAVNRSGLNGELS